MKRKIDIKKIKNLLREQRKTQKELAKFITFPESNLSSALNENGRTLPMNYVIDIATFFDVTPADIVTFK